MRLTNYLAALALTASASSPAMSAASQDVADKIKAALEAVFTATPGLITIAPTGEVYDLKIDIMPALSHLAEKNVKASVSPLQAKLTELGSGKWQVTSDTPLSYSLTTDPSQVMGFNVSALKFNGEFDEALGTFAKTEYELNDYVSTQKLASVGDVKSEASGGAKSMKGGSTSKANPNGGVDILQKYVMSNLSVNNTISSPGSAAPFSFSYTVDEISAENSAKGLRMKDVLNLAAWFVARPSVDKIKADQESLKALLRSGLPLVENLMASADIKKINVISQAGNVTVENAGFLLDLNGFNKEGKVREQLSLSGLSIPANLAPQWSAKLLPKDMTFDFTMSGFDAAAIAAFAIDKFDLQKNPPLGPELQVEFMRLALPGGVLNVTLDPNVVKSELYEIKVDGAFTVPMSGIPAGKGTVTMKGFDATIQALQTAAASDPSVQQVLGPFMVAKGFSKTEGDSLVWVVESNGAGGVLVNGIDVTKM